MWLLRFEGARPVLLASPADGFIGYVYEAVGEMGSKYGDLVIGMRMGRNRSELLSISGLMYEKIGEAKLVRKDIERGVYFGAG